MIQITFKAHRHYLDDINEAGSTTDVVEFGQRGRNRKYLTHLDGAGNYM